VEMLKFLIDQGALLEDHSQADEARIGAAGAGHLEAVKVLCSKGKVNPNVQDGQGRTALYYAAALKDTKSNQENGEEMAKFLLAKGADPNPLSSADGPLHQAALHGHLNMVHLLLEHGADPTRDGNGWCPLTNAIKYKSPEAMNLLLQVKISDPMVRNAWLERSLLYASRVGERGAVLQLLRAGANINAVEDEGVPKGATPPTARHPKWPSKNRPTTNPPRRPTRPRRRERPTSPIISCREWLRSCGSRPHTRWGDPNLKSGVNEDTLLILAAAKQHEKVIKVLLENGADKEAANRFGETALDIAEEKGQEEIVKLLES
jgi:ankyrin repeat protein